MESDAGRPITDVRQRFECDDFQEDVERILRGLGTVERSVKSNESDTRYVMRRVCPIKRRSTPSAASS